MGRALLAIAFVVGATLHVSAQFGDMPGLPGSSPPSAGPSGPQSMPPKCRELLAIRDELQKHGQAIEAANTKRADVKVACGLFRKYITTEAKMLKMLEADGALCGAPPQAIQQVRGSHAKSQQIGKQVCDAAARGPAHGAPSLHDALDPQPPRRERPYRHEDQLIPPKPLPRREPWPTRLSERQ